MAENENSYTRQSYTGRLLTAKEVAAILRVDEESIRRWLRDGVIPGVKLPGLPGASRHSWRIRGETVDAILAQGNETKTS